MTDERAILLAEPDSDARRAVSNLLKATGFSVAAATDYDGACEIADTTDVQLAVIGLEFATGPSGFVLLRAIKARAPHVPVIFLIGTADSEDVLAAFRLGASDVLLKPLRPSEFMSIVARELALDRAA